MNCIDKKSYSDFDNDLRLLLMKLILSDGKVDKKILIDFFDKNSHALFQYNKSIYYSNDSCNNTKSKIIQENEMSKELIDIFNKTNANFISGGSIINFVDKTIPFNDYDLYFLNYLNAKKCAYHCINNDFICRGITKNSINFEIPHTVQIIKRFYGAPYEIFSVYDIEACKVGIGKNENTYIFYYTDKAIENIKNKTIHLTNCHSNFISMFYRIQKYILKGFSIEPNIILDYYVKHIDDSSWMKTMHTQLMDNETKDEILDTLNKMKYSSSS